MSTATHTGTQTSGKRVTAMILGVIGALSIILGLIYVFVPAGSLPNMLGIGYIANSTGHHPLRAGAAFVVGVVLLVIAWLVGFRKPSAGSPGA